MKEERPGTRVTRYVAHLLLRGGPSTCTRDVAGLRYMSEWRERNVQRLPSHMVATLPPPRLLASTSNVFPAVNTRGRLTEAVPSPHHTCKDSPWSNLSLSLPPSLSPTHDAPSHLSRGWERLLLIALENRIRRFHEAACTRERERVGMTFSSRQLFLPLILWMSFVSCLEKTLCPDRFRSFLLGWGRERWLTLFPVFRFLGKLGGLVVVIVEKVTRLGIGDPVSACVGSSFQRYEITYVSQTICERFTHKNVIQCVWRVQRFSFASKIGREGRKRKEEGISYSIKPNNPRPVINTRRTNAWITRHIVCTVSLPVPWRDSALFIHAGFDGASNCRLRWIPSLEMALGIPKVRPLQDTVRLEIAIAIVFYSISVGTGTNRWAKFSSLENIFEHLSRLQDSSIGIY